MITMDYEEFRKLYDWKDGFWQDQNGKIVSVTSSDGQTVKIEEVEGVDD